MNDSEIQRVALVTGGAVRLGRAMALALADAGFDIMIHYHGSADAAGETAEAVAARGRRCHLVQTDLADEAGPASLIQAFTRDFSRMDVLVNSAASFQHRSLMDTDAGRWDDVMALNVRAPHLLVREAVPLLAAARGCVVNMVDLSATQAWTEYGAHAVSKAALAHLTRVQARTLAPEIRVNAIAPGAVLPPDDTPGEVLETLRTRTPLKSLGTPQDVVRALMYLVESPFVTGEILAVDGGRSLGSEGR